MGRTTAGWRAPPAPASPGAAAGRPAPAPARHSLGPAWRCLRPLAAARHCARPWWSSPLLVVRRARCPGKGGDLGRCYPPVTYPADRLRSLMLWRTRRAAMPALVRFAADNDVVLVHDFAYSDTAFDGYSPPSVLQVPGAKECSVELYTLTKSFSMAGWRVGFLVGNAKVVAALKKIKSYLDYGTFQPIQIAATVTLNDAPDYPKEVAAIYQGRRDALCDSFGRIGWEIERPRGTMFVWAPIPAAYADMGSLDFAQMLVTEAKVAVSPGVGFGLGGEGYVRFALIENEQRIAQAARTIRRALPKLG